LKTPILGGSYVARSINAADNRMVNLFPEAVPEGSGGKEAGFLLRCPGLRLVATVGDGPIRGLWVTNGIAYVVSGSEFYSLDTDWVATLIGTVSGTGPVSMADNGTQIFIACNPASYIYNVSTLAFAQITDVDFPGAGSVGYLDGYFVFNEPDSQKFWVTSLLDGTAIDPLDFASAEGYPDDVVALIVDHREIFLFGNTSVEVWYDAGTPDFPLARIQGAFMEVGCEAAYSVAKLDNSVFWLGSDARGRGIVYRANGYTPARISTNAVEYAIQSYGNITDAIGYTYQQDGHPFYVLVFPSAEATWVYDVSTQMMGGSMPLILMFTLMTTKHKNGCGRGGHCQQVKTTSSAPHTTAYSWMQKRVLDSMPTLLTMPKTLLLKRVTSLWPSLCKAI